MYLVAVLRNLALSLVINRDNKKTAEMRYICSRKVRWYHSYIQYLYFTGVISCVTLHLMVPKCVTKRMASDTCQDFLQILVV